MTEMVVNDVPFLVESVEPTKSGLSKVRLVPSAPAREPLLECGACLDGSLVLYVDRTEADNLRKALVM